MKRGLEVGEDFDRGVSAREFVGGEDESLRRGFWRRLRFGRYAAAIGERGDFHFNGDRFVFEISGGDGGESFLVRIGGELIGLFAGDAELARDVFGAKAHVDVGVGVIVDEPGIGGNFVAAHGDDDFGGAGTDAFGCEGDGLQAGRAEAVDGHSTRFDGESGAQSGDARDVHALFAFGHGAAENYIVDFLGVEVGGAGEGLFDGESGEIVGARSAQGAFVGAADGSADGGDDDGFGHGGPRRSRFRLHCWASERKKQLLGTGDCRRNGFQLSVLSIQSEEKIGNLYRYGPQNRFGNGTAIRDVIEYG